MVSWPIKLDGSTDPSSPSEWDVSTRSGKGRMLNSVDHDNSLISLREAVNELKTLVDESVVLTINPNHVFADSTERDSYFTTNPTELVTGIVISVGATFEQWDGDSWLDKTAIAQGPEGDKGDTGDSAPEVLIRYSVDGSTLWHSPFEIGDKYLSISTDNGLSWSDGILFYNEPVIESLELVDSATLQTADMIKSPIVLNSATDKTVTFPALTSDYNGKVFEFIIIGEGDWTISCSGDDKILTPTYTSFKGTSKYGSVTLQYIWSIKLFIIRKTVGSWGGV